MIEITLNSLKEIKNQVESAIASIENFIAQSNEIAPSVAVEAPVSTSIDNVDVETPTEATTDTLNAEAVVPATDPFNGATS